MLHIENGRDIDIPLSKFIEVGYWKVVDGKFLRFRFYMSILSDWNIWR